MKKIIFLTLITFLSVNLFAQNKLGHINAEEILIQMPEFKSAQLELQQYGKDLESRLSSLLAELEQLRTSYESNAPNLSDLERQDKELEMQGLYQRIEAFQADAQRLFQEKEQSLITPVQTKLLNAINEVAKEGNYTYILTAESLLFADESKDVGTLVRKKLGL